MLLLISVVELFTEKKYAAITNPIPDITSAANDRQKLAIAPACKYVDM